MNILELCLSPGLGGLELYVYRASESLAHDHNVTAVLTQGGKLDDYYDEHSAIRRIYLNNSKSPLPITGALKLANIIDELDIDLIHMHWGKDLALAAFAKTFSKKKPRLAYTRQMMITRYKNDFYHRFLYSRLDLLITITKQLESLCRKFITSENTTIQTLYYGVNTPAQLLDKKQLNALREKHGLAEDDFVAGLFGRLEDGKGQHLLIKAIALAKADGRNIKALIVGHEMSSGYRDLLSQLAESKGVAMNITFSDFVKDPQALMQICDCLCLTTYEETFGLVLPEAMRVGIPVIGSNKGGVPEIIDDGETGLLFESKDEHSLYQQLCRIYDDEAFKSKIANNGKAKADRVFDNDTHFRSLQEILSSEVRQ